MAELSIRTGTAADLELMSRYDHHIPRERLESCLSEGRILIAELEGNFVGWLRWGRFWDIVPFMNLLYVLDEYQGRGYGRALTEHWENMLKAQGCIKVMTSSQQDEFAQHFYVKLGYNAIGGFMLHGDPLEIIFEKRFD